MDREIKFRGLNRSEDWVYGGIYTRYEGKNLCTYITVHDFKIDSVVPETVGQYTGLKDQSDSEIYDGDILQTSDQTIWVVSMLNHGCWAATDVDDKAMWAFLDDFDFIIVGNIHTTPELLNKDN